MTDSDAEIVHTSQSACPDCGCEPGDAWGCNCGNPYCPCSEEEDGDDDE